MTETPSNDAEAAEMLSGVFDSAYPGLNAEERDRLRAIEQYLSDRGETEMVREVHLSGPGAVKIRGGVPAGDVEVVLDDSTEVVLEKTDE